MLRRLAAPVLDSVDLDRAVDLVRQVCRIPSVLGQEGDLAAFLAERGQPRASPPVTAFPMEHCNVISSWGVSAKGEVSNVYV